MQKLKKETGTKNKKGHKINVRFSFSQNRFVNKECVFWGSYLYALFSDF